jgi:hypothetical protein
MDIRRSAPGLQVASFEEWGIDDKKRASRSRKKNGLSGDARDESGLK